uniref:CSON005254 protein n=1 Tax=Culicoides sonorensis TaxID=179676 RepID=A0A336KA37_CULSO
MAQLIRDLQKFKGLSNENEFLNLVARRPKIIEFAHLKFYKNVDVTCDKIVVFYISSDPFTMGTTDSTSVYGRPRGFGFITFGDPASVDKVLAHGTHELDGKKIDPKVAFPRRAHPKMVTRTKKIFVGGLSAPTTLEDVKSYFEQFGPFPFYLIKFL